MKVMRPPLHLLTLALACGWSTAQELPKVNDPELEMSLVAAEPLIQTPTGIVFDGKGRLLVIESHTHFRPKDWKGPEKDQIVWLQDTDGDGKADARQVVLSDTVATMDLAWHPEGWVYAATRNEILRWRDDDDNGLPDKVERRVIFLETEGNYPHNGISGLSFDAQGLLYFGLGENLGADYKLRGADDEFTGGGEGGSIFRCTAEGKRLKRVATGFWNPFGVCLDPWGNIFATDNDPDSRPPCRLHHIVQGGDYGYQFRYGRSGLHPFISWDGELPGTLPMLAGTGEAPCDVMFCQWPQGGKWHGSLLVASWVDHRVESYQLKPKDATFEATQSLLLEGGSDFRPVAMAISPAGDLYVSDWVKRDYQLHGHGRIWRVRPKVARANAPALVAPTADPAEVLRQRILEGEAPTLEEARAWLSDKRPYLHSAAIWRMGREGALLAELAQQAWGDETLDAGVLLAAREAVKFEGGVITAPAVAVLLRSLAHPSDDVAVLALKWISDESLPRFRNAVENCMSQANASARVYYSAMTTLARMDQPEATEADLIKRLKSEIADDQLPAVRRKLALEIFPQRERQLKTADVLPVLTAAEDSLKPWLVHCLGGLRDADRLPALRTLALDEKQSAATRTAAMLQATFEPTDVAALSLVALGVKQPDAFRRAAFQAMQGLTMPDALAEHVRRLDNIQLRSYARRVAGESFAGGGRPAADRVGLWPKYIAGIKGDADPENGRLVFLSPKIGGCAACHQSEGLGAAAGPDLSQIAAVKEASGLQLLESILQPSRNVAPRYQCYQLDTTDGQTRMAFGVWEKGGTHQYMDLAGASFEVKIEDIVRRAPMPVSIMPEGILSRLTDEEVRDLLAYLTRR
jgi:putative membrane-bound dehydrogenase-like protein